MTKEEIEKIHYAYNSAFTIMKRCDEARPINENAQRKIFEMSEQIVEVLNRYVYVNMKT